MTTAPRSPPAPRGSATGAGRGAAGAQCPLPSPSASPPSAPAPLRLAQTLRIPRDPAAEAALTVLAKPLSPLSEPQTLRAWSPCGDGDPGWMEVPKAWGLKRLAGPGGAGAEAVVDAQPPCAAASTPPLRLRALRPHKTEALAALESRLRSSPLGGGGVVVLPCGFGKTVAALELCREGLGLLAARPDPAAEGPYLAARLALHGSAAPGAPLLEDEPFCAPGPLPVDVYSYLGPVDRARRRELRASQRAVTPPLTAVRDDSGDRCPYRLPRLPGFAVPLDATPDDPAVVTVAVDDLRLLLAFYGGRTVRRAADVAARARADGDADGADGDAGLLAAVHSSVRAVLWATRGGRALRPGDRPGFGRWLEYRPARAALSRAPLHVDVDSPERRAGLSLLLRALRPRLGRFGCRAGESAAADLLRDGARLTCNGHFTMTIRVGDAGGGRAVVPRGVDYESLAEGLAAAPDPVPPPSDLDTAWALEGAAPPEAGDGRILRAIAAAMAERRARRLAGTRKWTPGIVVEFVNVPPVADPTGYGTSFGAAREQFTGRQDHWFFRAPSRDDDGARDRDEGEPDGGRAEILITRWHDGVWTVQFVSVAADGDEDRYHERTDCSDSDSESDEYEVGSGDSEAADDDEEEAGED
ncbi:hypothetical protein JKP88DRAFT_279149 [Tribonema minus]|uniref:Uncharacterized protein n=1 Tax=Tribonema minus TaxID=303371 RepID=A0A836CCW5_9STRA|nr:hypothetical protein JKP88DRAFT_279149 [Tribonema minus]